MVVHDRIKKGVAGWYLALCRGAVARKGYCLGMVESLKSDTRKGSRLRPNRKIVGNPQIPQAKAGCEPCSGLSTGDAYMRRRGMCLV